MINTLKVEGNHIEFAGTLWEVKHTVIDDLAGPLGEKISKESIKEFRESGEVLMYAEEVEAGVILLQPEEDRRFVQKEPVIVLTVKPIETIAKN